MSCSAQVCKTASQELLHILWGSCLTRNGPGTNTVGIGGRNYTQKYQVFRPGVVFLLSTVNSLTSHLQHQTYLETVVNPQTLRCMLGKCGYGLCNCTLCVCVCSGQNHQLRLTEQNSFGIQTPRQCIKSLLKCNSMRQCHQNSF